MYVSEPGESVKYLEWEFLFLNYVLYLVQKLIVNADKQIRPTHLYLDRSNGLKREIQIFK